MPINQFSKHNTVLTEAFLFLVNTHLSTWNFNLWNFISHWLDWAIKLIFFYEWVNLRWGSCFHHIKVPSKFQAANYVLQKLSQKWTTLNVVGIQKSLSGHASRVPFGCVSKFMFGSEAVVYRTTKWVQLFINIRTHLTSIGNDSHTI